MSPQEPLSLTPIPGGDTAATAEATFTIDFDALAANGFFAPSKSPKRLSLELRAIKRRLLRRLNFRKRGARVPTGREGVAEARRRNLVLTTSTRPAEGKTFTSLNLALSLAIEDGIGVILIDADLPRPRVLKQFGLSPRQGFSDLVSDPEAPPVKDLLIHADQFPLSILSQGLYEGRSADLYEREETGEVLRRLSARYPDRLIILDAPPVLAMPDANILARHVDEVLFVVEAGTTSEPAVVSALDEVLDANEKISLILNKCLAAESAVHYGSYEEYYDREDR